MNKFVHLTSHDLEHLVVTIETSLRINNRYQFFLWAQGALQGFIPHETLFGAYGDVAKMSLKSETFSRVLLSKRAEQEVGDTVNGLLPRLADDWLRGGRTPRLSCADGDDQVGRRQLLTDIKHCGFGHVAAHGAKDVSGEFGSFFVFAGLERSPGAREAYLLEILMPHMHMALHRMLANPSSGEAPETVAVARLSKREIQVLHWVKNGKTNLEIGQILDISPTTAKNHVQRIMRKLKVNNRAQAVGKGATLRLLAPGEHA
jgi:transcriptional regulator EpsA